MSEHDRNLTDEDVKALVLELKSEFLLNVGSGVMDLAWKAAVICLVLLAAWGIHKG